MNEGKIKELTKELLRIVTPEAVKVVEEALREVAEQPEDDGYLYFGGEGQEKYPRLPEGVKVEVRDVKEGIWQPYVYVGYDKANAYRYSVVGNHFKYLRVKKSEIIDIGEWAVERLVEAWNDGEALRGPGFCKYYGADGTYCVICVNGTGRYSHVRLINNAEREAKDV